MCVLLGGGEVGGDTKRKLTQGKNMGVENPDEQLLYELVENPVLKILVVSTVI